MRQIVTEIEIEASADRVWRELMNFKAYPEWNPFITQIDGEAAVGHKLHVRIEPPGRKPMTFTPTLLKADPSRELKWRGQLLIRGLFDGEHTFTIHSMEPTRVRFVQSEVFSGILVPLLWNTIASPTTDGFHLMNKALQARATGET